MAEHQRLSMPELEHRFNYHPPSPAVADLHSKVRTRHLELAKTILTNIPAGREQSICFTKIEESMFWANAALARHYGKPDVPQPDEAWLEPE